MKFLKITKSFPADGLIFGIDGNGMNIEDEMIMSIHLLKYLDGEKIGIMVNKS
jgi:hypothetical protein